MCVYCRLQGSYAALGGCSLSDALVDWTGGVSELVELQTGQVGLLCCAVFPLVNVAGATAGHPRARRGAVPQTCSGARHVKYISTPYFFHTF